MLSDNNVKSGREYRHANRFHPVILFHDDNRYQRSIHYGDPYYRPMIQIRKEQMDQMLKVNSQRWQHILQSTSSATPELMHGVADNLASCLLMPTPPPSGTALGTTTPTSSSSSSSSSTGTSPPPSSPPYPPHRCRRPQSLSQHRQDCYYEEHSVSNSSGSSSSSSSSNRKRRRGNLPKTVTSVLKHWLTDHCQHPYPTEEEKMALRQRTGLTLNQISNWFINARRRILPLIILSSQPSSPLHDQNEEEQDLNYDPSQLVSRVSPKPLHHKEQQSQQHSSTSRVDR